MATIAVDFDGVIHKYSKGWDNGSIYDEPMSGAKEALESLKSKGHKIIIFSTRSCDRITRGKSEKSQLTEMEEWFNKYQIPYDEIWTKPWKPMAKVYIDDRGLRFENWQQTLSDLSEIIPKN